MCHWRVIPYIEGHPTWNMALDEAILEALISGDAPPTLRFYGWSVPSITIGRLQKIKSVPEEWDGTIVRRPTGGRAVNHTRDIITFSVIVGADILGSPVSESYRRVGEAVSEALTSLDIPAEFCQARTAPESVRAIGNCFELSLEYELAVEGDKVLGSAQVRRNGFVLQQNSLEKPEGTQWPSISEIESAIIESFKHKFDSEFCFGNISETELQMAHQLTDNKYATEAWNNGCASDSN